MAAQVVDAVFTVYRALGPGLLENVYEVCLCRELSKRGLEFKPQVSLPIVYDSVRLEAGLRLDFWVADCLVVELKAVEQVLPVHLAQLVTYLKLSGYRLGLLVNFNTELIKDGIFRRVN